MAMPFRKPPPIPHTPRCRVFSRAAVRIQRRPPCSDESAAGGADDDHQLCGRHPVLSLPWSRPGMDGATEQALVATHPDECKREGVIAVRHIEQGHDPIC